MCTLLTGDSLLNKMIKRELPAEELARQQFAVTVLIGLVSVLQHLKTVGIIHGDLHGTQTFFITIRISMCSVHCNTAVKLPSFV